MKLMMGLVALLKGRERERKRSWHEVTEEFEKQQL